MMKMTDIIGKSPAQLAEALIQLRREQMNLRFQKAAGQLALQFLRVAVKVHHQLTARSQQGLLGKVGRRRRKKCSAGRC